MLIRRRTERLRSAVTILGLNYPPELTGIAPYTGGLAAGLRAIGYRVSALVAHPHYPEWSIQQGYGQWASAEDVDGVRVRRFLHYVPRSPRGIRRLVSELSFGVRLVFARWGYSKVVIAVSPSLFSTGLAALRLWITPRPPNLIVWVQDIYTLGLAETGEGGGLAGAVTRWVETHTLRAADRVVVIHQRFADYVSSELGVDGEKVVVIRNWAHLPDTEPLSPTAARSLLGWPADVTLAVHTGNMGVKQGLENIIDAARIADERGMPVHFMLVGDGGERQRLTDIARGIARVTFVDSLSEADYHLALGAADVLLVNEKPGISEMAVPSKLTSYFHAGRPVIAATDLDGITASEVVSAGAGVVVPAGEPASLLNAIVAMSADGEAALELGRNGRRYRNAVLGEQAAIEQWNTLLAEVGGRIGEG
ncbi:glycosyltransferase family 4 protein [Mycolicibacterium hippocampi]|uniref:glycosyltransferase family 4 protein n=1 Tax=Mycolicibacterium hippocampi TaxID=659824 RepID=UPI003511420C